jgi:hypothetical protein
LIFSPVILAKYIPLFKEDKSRIVSLFTFLEVKTTFPKTSTNSTETTLSALICNLPVEGLG